MRLLVLYGSQTGTAQDVAEQIWRESKLRGFTGAVLPMDEYPMQQLIEEQLLVVVAATTGNGDEPDNMKQSWKFLLRKSLPAQSLQRLQVACLGLGDSSYAKFNFTAKKLHKRLLQLGASSLLPLGLCDDQHDHGLGAVALPWMQQLWQELERRFAIKPITPAPQTVFKWQVQVVQQQHSALDSLQHLKWPLPDTPQHFTLLENQRTTAPEHFQDVRLLKFEWDAATETRWLPGDILNVRPCNSEQQVDDFFALLREHNLPFNSETVVQLSANYEEMPLPFAYAQPTSLRLLAKYIWDLSAKPRARAFELLALNCADELEREKLQEFNSVEGLDGLIQYIHRPRRNVLELLQDFRHATAQLQLHMLFELFTPIQTRSFSIASVPAQRTLDLLVAVVEYKTKLSTPRLGLCSTWLRELQPGDTILGVIKRGTMSLPKQPETPLIMVGPGTGVAPFRSVIQHKSEQQATGLTVGETVLYFGCRNKSSDFHFREDFELWQQTQTATVFTAFSRDQEHKVYVQHLIRENGQLLQQLIKEQQAVVLVAGSSKNMPKAVKEAFIAALANDAEYVENMFKSKRYQEETWS